MYFFCIYHNATQKIKYSLHYSASKKEMRQALFNGENNPICIWAYSPLNPKEKLAKFLERILDYQMLGKSFNESIFLMSTKRFCPLPKWVIKPIVEDLSLGLDLNQTLKKHPVFFDDSILQLITYAQRTGKINSFIQLWLSQYSKSKKLKETLKKQLFYPMILLIMSVFLLLFYQFKIKPHYQALFITLGIPWESHSTKALSPFIFLLIPLSLMAYHKRFNFPILGKFKQTYDWWVWLNCMHISLEAGFTFHQSIQLSLKCLPHLHQFSWLESMHQQLRLGGKIEDAMHHYLPWAIQEAIEILMTQGESSKIFDVLASQYEQKLQKNADRMEQYLQPLLMMLLALLCTKIIWLMYQPLLNIGQKL